MSNIYRGFNVVKGPEGSCAIYENGHFHTRVDTENDAYDWIDNRKKEKKGGTV